VRIAAHAQSIGVERLARKTSTTIVTLNIESIPGLSFRLGERYVAASGWSRVVDGLDESPCRYGYRPLWPPLWRSFVPPFSDSDEFGLVALRCLHDHA